MILTIDYDGTKFDVDAEFTPAQRGGVDDPSWPDYWEIDHVWVSGPDHSKISDLAGFLSDNCPGVIEKMEAMLLKSERAERDEYMADRGLL